MKRINYIYASLVLCIAVSAFAQNGNSNVKSKFADFNGARVHYYETGKGADALVFVHGWACNTGFWKTSFNEFPAYRVIAIDLVGHGQSDKPKVTYNMDYFARSVEAVLKDAKVKKAVLVGHSMGTPVARQFYRLYPQKTAGIVIVDGALRAYGTKEQMETFYAPLRSDYRKTAAGFIDGMIQPIKDENLKKFIRDAMLATPDYVGLSAMESFSEEKIWEKDRIKVPVLAILAPSPFWKPDEKDYFKSIAPNLDFQMWENVSHFLMMEKPKEFNEQVKGFIVKNKLLQNN